MKKKLSLNDGFKKTFNFGQMSIISTKKCIDIFQLFCVVVRKISTYLRVWMFSLFTEWFFKIIL